MCCSHVLLHRIINDALEVRWAQCTEFTFHFSLVQHNTQQFPHRVINSGKGAVFLSAVKVRDIVSREDGPVFTEQKKFTTHPPRSLVCLSLYVSLSLSLQCVAREAACSSSGWLVWSRWEDGVCGAVCCGLRFTTGTIPPPASALAAHCSPGKGPYPPLPIPSCLWRNASGPRTLNTRPLFCFFIHGWAYPQPSLSLLVSLFLARHNICDATWPACQSSHLIIWALTF